MELQLDAKLVSFLDANTVEEAERVLASALLEHGYVKPSYVSAVLERERDYPTALELGGYCVAIPHTESEHTRNGGIALGVLKKPVMWRRMDDPDELCPVSLVIMLAVNDPHDHLELLQRVIGLVQDQGLIRAILAADVPEDVINLVAPILCN